MRLGVVQRIVNGFDGLVGIVVGDVHSTSLHGFRYLGCRGADSGFTDVPGNRIEIAPFPYHHGVELA